MKRFLGMLAAGVLALGLSTAVHAQTRVFSAGGLQLDDLQTPAHTVTVTAPTFGSPEWLVWQSAGFPALTWTVPVPPAPGAQAGFVFTGPLTGTVVPNISYWVPPGQTGFNNNGGNAGAWDYATAAQLGLVGGSGTANQITKWNGAGTGLTNSGLSDNGSIISTTEFIDLGNATTQGVLRMYSSSGTLYTLAPSLGAMEINNNFRILGNETATGTITAGNGGAAQVTLGTSGTNEISANDGTLNTSSNLNVNSAKFFVNATTGNVGIGVATPGSQLTNATTNISDQSGDGLNGSSLNWQVPNGAGGGYAVGVLNNDVTSVNPHGLIVRTASTIPNTRVFTANAGGSDLMNVWGNGNINMGTNTATSTLINSQTVSTPNIGSTASASNVLVLNGGNIVKSTATFPTGSGTLNAIPKWTPSGSALGDSKLTDDGTTLNYNAGQLTVAAATGNTNVAGTLTTAAGITATTGNVTVTAGNLALPATSATAGQVIIAGTRFIHSTNSGTFVGRNAGNLSLTGNNNVGVGQNALTSATSGAWNTAVGDQSLATLVTGIHNVAVGVSALANHTGNNSTAVGANALSAATGSDNTGIGNDALNAVTTGTGNTAIGAGANVTVGTVTNTTLVGAGASSGLSNQVVLGNAGVTTVSSAGRYTSTAGVSLSGAAATLTLNGSVGNAGDLLRSAGAGATPTWVSGATAFIQNQNASAQTANFWVSGDGQLGGSLTVAGASTLNGGLGVVGNNATTERVSTVLSDGANSTFMFGHPVAGTGDFGTFNSQVLRLGTYGNPTNSFNPVVTVTSDGTPANNAVGILGAVDMNSHKITNVTDPTAAQDAATKNYVDVAVGAVSGYLPLTGGTMSGAIDMNTSVISNIGNAGTDFSATGGLTLADALTVSAGGAAITGNTSVAGTLNMNSHLINNVTNPVSAQDAATKSYVDARPGVLAWGVVSFDSVAGTATLVSSYNCTSVTVGGGPFFTVSGITGTGSHTSFMVTANWAGGVGSKIENDHGNLAGWWSGSSASFSNYVPGGGGAAFWPQNYVSFVVYAN